MKIEDIKEPNERRESCNDVAKYPIINGVPVKTEEAKHDDSEVPEDQVLVRLVKQSPESNVDEMKKTSGNMIGISHYHKREENVTQLGNVMCVEKSQDDVKSSLQGVKKPVLDAEETGEVKDEDSEAPEVQQVLVAEDNILAAEDQVLAAEDQVLAREVQEVVAAEDQ